MSKRAYLAGRKHGTRSCYVGGCRLPECVAAELAYHRQYYRKWRLTPAAKKRAEKLRLARATKRDPGVRATVAGWLSSPPILIDTRERAKPETGNGNLSGAPHE